MQNGTLQFIGEEEGKEMHAYECPCLFHKDTLQEICREAGKYRMGLIN